MREMHAYWCYRAAAFLQKHRNDKHGRQNLWREQLLASTYSGTQDMAQKLPWQQRPMRYTLRGNINAPHDVVNLKEYRTT